MKLISLVLVLLIIQTNLDIGINDFSQYWASAKLLENNQNPYDQKLLNDFQKKYAENKQVLLWTPPLIFPFIFWLKYFNFKIAASIWFVLGVIVSIFVTGLFVKSKYHIDQRGKLDLLSVLIIGTSPAIIFNFYLGQTGFILLASMALYFCFKVQNQDFFAGLFLSISLIKPHLLYLFYFWILLEALNSKKANTLLGFIIGAGLLSIATLLIAPESFSWYYKATLNLPIFWKTVTLGSALRSLQIVDSKYILYLPSLIALLSLVAFYPKLFVSQQFKDKFAFLLIPLSLLTAPYGWPFDAMLIMPTLIIALYELAKNAENQNRVKITLLLLIMVASNLLSLVYVLTFALHAYFWQSIVLLLFCWHALFWHNNYERRN